MDTILTLIFGELTAASIWEACGQRVNDTGEIDLLMVIQYFTERKWNSKFWKMIGRQVRKIYNGYYGETRLAQWQSAISKDRDTGSNPASCFSFSFTYIFQKGVTMSKKWGWIELGAEIVCGIATVVSLVAGMKNDEDLDERVKRIMCEEEEEH